MATKMANGNISESKDTDVSKNTELVQKRFKMDKVWSGKVFAYRRVLSGKWAREQKNEPLWEDALVELLKTHPALKNLNPENEN
jgi:hypothetical protein